MRRVGIEAADSASSVLVIESRATPGPQSGGASLTTTLELRVRVRPVDDSLAAGRLQTLWRRSVTATEIPTLEPSAGIGSLPLRPEGYGSVTSLLALNFFPDSEAAVHEMRSVAAPEATVSACVWDYGDGMQFLRHFWDAAGAVDSAARELDEGNRFPLCRRDALTALFRNCGLAAVRCEPLEIPTVFANFDDYWRPLLGGTGPAPSFVASLGADRRTILARKLEQALPRGLDGTIALTARAWAVRGTVT